MLGEVNQHVYEQCLCKKQPWKDCQTVIVYFHQLMVVRLLSRELLTCIEIGNPASIELPSFQGPVAERLTGVSSKTVVVSDVDVTPHNSCAIQRIVFLYAEGLLLLITSSTYHIALSKILIVYVLTLGKNTHTKSLKRYYLICEPTTT